MTLVEFFSKNPLENMMATLFFRPKKTVFVDFENSISDTDKSKIKKYFRLKKINSEVEFVNIEKRCFSCAVSVLENICEKNERCVFDFTGGEEIILAAMGYVMAKCEACAIETDPFANLIYADLQRTVKPVESDITNDIYENFVMFGAVVDKRKLKPEKQYLSANSYEEIQGLWNILIKNPSAWNSTCTVLNSLSDCYFPKEKENVTFKRLVQNRYIIINGETKKSYSISYKNEIVRLCLCDPGTVLELYTYHTLEKSYRFDDVKVGVTVDWDGYFHNDFQKSRDTSNEIDVVAIKGLRPVYISCKNGKVSKETLYELETVANRFGDIYAAKVLIAPMLKMNSVSNQYIINRAADMGITVITDVCSITAEEYVNRILGAFEKEERIK